MRTIQMTLDDNLVASVDRVVKKLKTTRSAFTRKALKDAIKQVNLNMLEKKHKTGYRRYPIEPPHKLKNQSSKSKNAR